MYDPTNTACRARFPNALTMAGGRVRHSTSTRAALMRFLTIALGVLRREDHQPRVCRNLRLVLSGFPRQRVAQLPVGQRLRLPARLTSDLGQPIVE